MTETGTEQKGEGPQLAQCLSVHDTAGKGKAANEEGRSKEEETAQGALASSAHHPSPDRRGVTHSETLKVPPLGGIDRKRYVLGLDRNLGNWKEINCSTQQVGRNGLETSQHSDKVLQGKPELYTEIPSSQRLSACVGGEAGYKHEPQGEALENARLQQSRDHIPQILLVCLWNAKQIEWLATAEPSRARKNMSGI